MSRLNAHVTKTLADSTTGVRLTAGILILAGVAAYSNSLGVPFFFDDPPAILENPSIRNLTSLGAVLSPPNDGSGVTGRPVINLSLALNHALGGTNPAGYHAANIVFHLLAALTLLGVVRRTLLLPSLRARFAGAALPIGFLTAGLWLLHPLQTESVTCVIQRTELVVGLFFLLTLYGFIRAVETNSARWSGCSVAACFLGMASKEVMVSAPLLVLLYDRAFVAGSLNEAWRQRRGLYLGLAASWLLLAWLVLGAGGTRGAAAGFGVGVTWWSYALKQCEAIILYLQLSAWPNPLVVFYGTDVVTNPAEVWSQGILLLALVIATLWAAWRRPMVGFVGLWFFFILAPSSSVVPLVTQTVSEHRMYLPLAAPIVLLIAGLHRVLGQPVAIAALVAAVSFAATTRARNHNYRSELAIWTDTVAKAPRNARAHIILGATHAARGNPAAALVAVQTALRLDPESPEALNNLASLLIGDGRAADAIEPCRRALRVKPKFFLAHNNLGTALVQTGRAAEGAAHLRTALELKPGFAEAHCNLGHALLQLGETATATEHLDRALALRPDFPLVHFHLATAWLQKGEPPRAIAALESALRLRPDYAEAHSNLGGLIYQSGDPARAIPHFEAALRVKPGFTDARGNLASALFQAGRFDDAVTQYRALLESRPDHSDSHFYLALALTRLGRNADAIAAHEAALRLNPGDPRARTELARLRALTPAPPR